MTYCTPQQLRTQADLAKRQIAIEDARLEEVRRPDWELARTYGEEIRKNHIETISRRIEHLRRRIKAIEMALPRGEAA